MTGFNKLSIVVPIGPDDAAWRQLLQDLANFGTAPEIILSACRPWSDALELPENARWLQGAQGRARQLNAGARETSNRFIWFLHADTRLSPGVDTSVRHFIDSNVPKLAYFRLKFANDGPVLTRLNAWAANWRSRRFGLPFGDQGFIVDRSVYERLHGFDESAALGEDLDFVVRWQAAGFELLELPAELVTSARRYRQHGWLSTTLEHVRLTWRLTREARRRLAVVR